MLVGILLLIGISMSTSGRGLGWRQALRTDRMSVRARGQGTRGAAVWAAGAPALVFVAASALRHSSPLSPLPPCWSGPAGLFGGRAGCEPLLGCCGRREHGHAAGVIGGRPPRCGTASVQAFVSAPRMLACKQLSSAPSLAEAARPGSIWEAFKRKAPSGGANGRELTRSQACCFVCPVKLSEGDDARAANSR